MDDIRTYISVCIEVPCTIFHCTVLVFLIHQKHRGRREFASGFYTLFIFLVAYDLLNIVLNYIFARFSLYGWFPAFYMSSHALARFASLSLSFLAYFQFWSNMLMAYNRFFAIAFPMEYTRMCEGYGLLLSLAANHVVPLVLTAVKAPVDVAYAPVANGSTSLELAFSEDVVSRKWNDRSTYVSTLIGVTITVITLLLEVATILSIRRFVKSMGTLNLVQNNDIRLVFLSAFTFATQLWLLINNFGQLFAYKAGQMTIVAILRAQNYWNYDIQTLSPCIAMLLISSFVRREYLAFYHIRRRDVAVRMVSQTASNQQLALNGEG